MIEGTSSTSAAPATGPVDAVRAGTPNPFRGPLNDAIDKGTEATGFGAGAWNWLDDLHDSTWGRLETGIGAAGRHAINNLGGLGLPGYVWNVRDAYRNDYTDDKRIGAAIGDAATIGVAALIVHSWRNRGFSAPQLYRLPKPVVTVAGLAMLGAAATSGVIRTIHNTQDDGDFRALGATAGIAAGALLSRAVPGKWPSRIALVVAPLIAGIAGYQLGRRLQFGDGHLGEANPESSRLEHAPALAAARGAWTHFAEAGPLSQGTGFGSTWGQVADMRERYTDAELAGGMAGDLFAGTIVGTTALIATGRVLGRAQTSRLTTTPLARLGMELSVPARVVNKLRDVDGLWKIVPDNAEREVEKIAVRSAENVGRRAQESWWNKLSKYALKYDGKVPQLLYVAGGVLFAYTMWEAWRAGENSKNSRIGGPLSMGITAAGVIGGAALVAKYAPGVRDLAKPVRPGVALIAASATAAAISMLREPVGSYIDGAVELHQRRGGAKLEPWTLGLAGGVGLGGGIIGARAASIMGFTGGMRVGSVALGAALGAAAGWGFAPLVAPRHASTGPTDQVESDTTG